MGAVFNPNNESFTKDRNCEIYVDKTGLLAFLNKKLNTPRNCIAVSHARRFGKSHAAGMIDAYYSLGSSSYNLFQGTQICKDENFKKHLNKYNTIHVDVASFWDPYREDMIQVLVNEIYKELKEVYPTIDYTSNISLVLVRIYEQSQIPFVIILDEWDCVVRDCNNNEFVHKYMQFLRSLFKSEESKRYLALAYITGILPIKKIKNESALNNFDEFTMLDSSPITKYFGFTEDELKELCQKFGSDFDLMKSWYDGYLIDDIHMYNPNSVCMAISKNRYDSYWKNTSSFESINTFIHLNYEGLKEDVLAMLAGDKVYVNTENFQNDFNDLHSKNDALTSLIHLGYLAYDHNLLSAYVPNFEVKKAFQSALATGNWKKIAQSIAKCDELLIATIQKKSDQVAQMIDLAHEAYASLLKYNDENSLSCVLTMAYYTIEAYYRVDRELASGLGFCDWALTPLVNAGHRPAMIIELKYDQSAKSAINQIKEKRYHGKLANYYDKILLVGINYDPKSKKHTCIIEEWYNQ